MEYLFYNRNGGPLNKMYISRMLKKYTQKAGIPAYSAEKIYDADPEIAKLVDFIISKEMFAIGNKKSLIRLYMEIVTKDWFMTLLDLKDYIKVKEQALKDYEDRDAWAQKMIVNISKAGFFSSDRTIAQYNEEIWKLK